MTRISSLSLNFMRITRLCSLFMLYVWAFLLGLFEILFPQNVVHNLSSKVSQSLRYKPCRLLSIWVAWTPLEVERTDMKSEFFTFFGFMTTVRSVPEIKVATNCGNLWRYLHPWSSIYQYVMFSRDLIVRSAKAAFVSLIVEYISIPSGAQTFLDSPAYTVPWSTHIFFGLFLLVVIFENVFRLQSSSILCSVKRVSTYKQAFNSIVSRLLINKRKIHAPDFVSD